MNVLFVHQNFPSQFIHLSAALAQNKRNRVVALAIDQRAAPAGVELRLYSLLRASGQVAHPLLAPQEAHVLRAEACAAAALKLKHDGFEADVIIAHPGWGEALFLKDVFPRARLVLYCEYYYATEGQDVGFDPDDTPLTFAQRCHLRLKNTTSLLSMEAADAAISPTQWQKSTFPSWMQQKITVIHDGIDSRRTRFNPAAVISLARPGQRALHFRPGDEIVSYVARNLEPVRGFHVFMRTLPEVLRQRKGAHAIVVGGNGPGYGARPNSGSNWKEIMLQEVGNSLDLSRVHFVGNLTYDAYLNLLSVSRVHAYWTVPFVLSWSFLEAISSGLPVIASNTPPVAEFAKRAGEAVQMADFFDQTAFGEHLQAKLASHRKRPERNCLPPEVELDYCLARQLALIESL